MFKDFDSIDDLLPLASFVPGSFGAFADLYKEIGPEMPSDLKSTPLKTDLPDAQGKVLHFNYDEGHAGRFSVPHSNGGSLAFDWLMAREDYAEYMSKYIMFHDVVDDAAAGKASELR